MASAQATPLPYDRPGYAATYDRYYNSSEINRPHFEFECDMVAGLIRDHDAAVWVDIACGTGLHLRTVETERPISRIGLDRSAGMLGMIPRDSGIETIRGDLCQMDDSQLPKGDIVTHFWYGYIHQETVSRVECFMRKTLACVRPGGTLMLGICDPANLFETIRHEHQVVYGDNLNIEALVWSFEEPWGNDRFDNCIAVHPERILSWLGPSFGHHLVLDYPGAGGKCNTWRRKGLLLQNRVERD